MNYKIAVITPTYNSEAYISKFFQSLFNLKLNGLKIIWVFADGGSKDRTTDLIKSQINKLPFEAFVISKKDKNMAEGRNNGFRFLIQRYGNFYFDFITLIDSDIAVVPDFFLKILKHFTDPKVVCGISLPSEELKTKFLAKYYVKQEEKFIGKILPIKVAHTICTVVRKKCFNYFDERFNLLEDADLSLSIHEKGYKLLKDYRLNCPHLAIKSALKELKYVFIQGTFKPLLLIKHPAQRTVKGFIKFFSIPALILFILLAIKIYFIKWLIICMILIFSLNVLIKRDDPKIYIYKILKRIFLSAGILYGSIKFYGRK